MLFIFILTCQNFSLNFRKRLFYILKLHYTLKYSKNLGRLTALYIRLNSLASKLYFNFFIDSLPTSDRIWIIAISFMRKSSAMVATGFGKYTNSVCLYFPSNNRQNKAIWAALIFNVTEFSNIKIRVMYSLPNAHKFNRLISYTIVHLLASQRLWMSATVKYQRNKNPVSRRARRGPRMFKKLPHAPLPPLRFRLRMTSRHFPIALQNCIILKAGQRVLVNSISAYPMRERQNSLNRCAPLVRNTKSSGGILAVPRGSELSSHAQQ